MEMEKESKILEAAQTVFLRYGFRRVTMNDIAEEAGMSRPALYLVFANKEEVFKGAVKQFSGQILEEIRHGLDRRASAEEKLRYVFELWAVRPFETIQSSPDARDLIGYGQGFAKPVMDEIYQSFEEMLAGILKPLMNDGTWTALSAEQLARLLTNSVQGFKESAGTAAELRQMIDGLLTLTLVALDPSHVQMRREVRPRRARHGGRRVARPKQ
jgi:AcrR family transcriptional regulator